MQIQVISQTDVDSVDPTLQFVHPRLLLEKLTRIMKEVGSHTFLTGTKHGDDRDLLIGCLFSFFPRRVLGREWFIQKPYRFPDLELVSFTERQIMDKPLDCVSVEITTIVESIQTFDEAVESLKQHKLAKVYQEDKSVVLLIFINNRQAPAWSKGLSSFFESSKDKFGQVFAIYLMDVNSVDSFVFEVDCLRPGGVYEVFKLSEEINTELIPNQYFERFARKISRD